MSRPVVIGPTKSAWREFWRGYAGWPLRDVTDYERGIVWFGVTLGCVGTLAVSWLLS